MRDLAYGAHGSQSASNDAFFFLVKEMKRKKYNNSLVPGLLISYLMIHAKMKLLKRKEKKNKEEISFKNEIVEKKGKSI